MKKFSGYNPVMTQKQIVLIEICLWIFAIFVISIAGYFSFNKIVNSYPVREVTFKDVDGLTKGSPVKLSGIKIGYVNKISIQNDNVKVSFVITKKGIEIPKDTFAVVEFYGLGGSKSLELKPSAHKDNSNVITTKMPYRISGYYEQSNNINTTLELMSLNTSKNLNGFLSSEVKNISLNKVTKNLNSGLKKVISTEQSVWQRTNETVEKFNKKHSDILTTCDKIYGNREDFSEDKIDNPMGKEELSDDK